MPSARKVLVKPCACNHGHCPKCIRKSGNRQQRNSSLRAGFGTSRQERRSNLGLQVGEAFNPFSLFDGALVPSEILRSRHLLPSEKLVFARLHAVCRVETEGPGLPSSASPKRSRFPFLRLGAASAPWKAKGSSAESRAPGVRTNSSSCGMRSTNREPRSPMIDVPRSPMSAHPHHL